CTPPTGGCWAGARPGDKKCPPAALLFCGAPNEGRLSSGRLGDKKGRGVARTGSADTGGGMAEAAGTGGGEGACSDSIAFSNGQRSRDRRASLALAIS